MNISYVSHIRFPSYAQYPEGQEKSPSCSHIVLAAMLIWGTCKIHIFKKLNCSKCKEYNTLKYFHYCKKYFELALQYSQWAIVHKVQIIFLSNRVCNYCTSLKLSTVIYLKHIKLSINFQKRKEGACRGCPGRLKEWPQRAVEVIKHSHVMFHSLQYGVEFLLCFRVLSFSFLLYVLMFCMFFMYVQGKQCCVQMTTQIYEKGGACDPWPRQETPQGIFSVSGSLRDESTHQSTPTKQICTWALAIFSSYYFQG